MAKKPRLDLNPLDPLTAVLGASKATNDIEQREDREDSKEREDTKGITKSRKRTPKRTRFTVLLDDELIDKLRDLAVCRYTTLAAITEVAVREYIEKVAHGFGGQIPSRGDLALKTGRPIGLER